MTGNNSSEMQIRTQPVIYRYSGVLLLAVVLSMVSITGCEGCGTPSLAVLKSHSGMVHRDFAVSQLDWKVAEDGARFEIGDGIQTGKGATARLRLRNSSRLQMKESSTIRFARPGKNPKELSIRILSGIIIFDGVEEETRLNTGFGVAILDKGAALKMTHTPDGVLLEVSIGMAMFIAADGETHELVAGGTPLRATIEDAFFLSDESDNSEPDSAEKEDGNQSGTEPRSLGDTEAVSSEMPLAPDSEYGEKTGILDEGVHPLKHRLKPELRIPVGGRVWIHTVAAPVSIAISVPPACPNGAQVKQVGHRQTVSSASREVVLKFRLGDNRYRMYCLSEAGSPINRMVASGTVVVIRDREKFQLAQTAPRTTVMTDGRKYNVTYQGKLPAIHVQWPEAPDGGGYTLMIKGAGTPMKLALSSPSHHFNPGDLKEGVYTLRFVFNETGFRSRTTSLHIKFDNTADKAVISQPREGSFSPGETLTVRGLAIPGWKVTSPNGLISVDDTGRFSGEVTDNPAYGGIVLVFSHPGRGQHYYLRRSR